MLNHWFNIYGIIDIQTLNILRYWLNLRKVYLVHRLSYLIV